MRKGTDGGDGIWGSESGREIMEAYMEMLEEKYPDDADRPTFDVVLWEKVIKSRSVGSVFRKQALGGLHPRFADSSCFVKGPVTHDIGSSQSSELPNYVTNAILNDRMSQLELTMKQVLEAMTRGQPEREPRRSHHLQKRSSSCYGNMDEEEEEEDGNDYCSDYDELQYQVRQQHYEDVGGENEESQPLDIL